MEKRVVLSFLHCKILLDIFKGGMIIMENEITKESLLKYSFYDDDNRLNVVINEEFLKKLFNADTILLNEYEHR